MDMVFVKQNMKYITIVKWACHTGCCGTDISNWEHVKDQQFLVQYISRNEILRYGGLKNINAAKCLSLPDLRNSLGFHTQQLEIQKPEKIRTVDKNSKSALNLINIIIKE